MIPAENQDIKPNTIKNALNQLLILSINFIGFLGIILILYAVVSDYYQSDWLILEKIANHIAIITTIAGTTLTAISVYMPVNMRKPEAFSIFISAPIVIIGCIIAFFYTLQKHFIPPDHFVNGIAIVGLSGALFRLISR